jgi:hypothetical protein
MLSFVVVRRMDIPPALVVVALLLLLSVIPLIVPSPKVLTLADGILFSFLSFLPSHEMYVYTQQERLYSTLCASW